MTKEELNANVSEYQKEYEWLKDETKLTVNELSKSTIWVTDAVVFMRQYAESVAREAFQQGKDYKMGEYLKDGKLISSYYDFDQWFNNFMKNENDTERN
jgi:hypothetical protein